MEDKNIWTKVAIIAVILAVGVPIYQFAGITLEKRRDNAIKNSAQPWAPEVHYSVAWRYSVSLREDVAKPLYIEWLYMFGGDAVVARLFPERWALVYEADRDDAIVLAPPRANKDTAHRRTAEVLLWHAYALEESKLYRPARETIYAMRELCPNMESWIRTKADNLAKRCE